MITAEQERFILSKAYVSEHAVPLMTTLSGGEPFLIDGFFLLPEGRLGHRRGLPV